MSARWWRRVATAAAVLATAASRATAQVAPDHAWRTIITAHFDVHFTAATEAVARRAAVDAEDAYAALARELHRPRGRIALVVADDADQSNGSATPFPTNRIIVYASPPVGESALRFTDDWTALVVTHELTHVFHLDRVRGIWRVGQSVFGRSPLLFPNLYTPAWLTEGLAVYYESRLTGGGRIAGSEHRMIARAAAVDHRIPALSSVSLASPNFPFGESAYAYGSLLVNFIAETNGADRVGTFIEKSSAQLIPFNVDRPARQAFGMTFRGAYARWRDSVARAVATLGDARTPLPAWRDLTTHELFAAQPRWWGSDALVYAGTTGRETFSAWRVDTGGRRTRVGRRNSPSPQVPLADGGLLYSQLDFTGPYTLRGDLYASSPRGDTRRLTRGARLADPDVRADGAIVAVQSVPGFTQLVRVSSSGGVARVIAPGSLDTLWTEPRWSHAGDRIAAVRWRRGGIGEIVILDSLGSELAVVASGHSVQSSPSWSTDDQGVYYSSDRTGTAQVYRASLGSGEERVVSRAVTGLFDPVAASGDRLAAVVFRSGGFQLGVGACCAGIGDTAAALAQAGHLPTPPVRSDSSPSRPYAAWRYLGPRFWIPLVGRTGTTDGLRLGGTTGAFDPVGRHAWSAALLIPTDNTGITGGLFYQYAGLGLPILSGSATRDVTPYGFIVGSQNQLLAPVYRRDDDVSLLATWLRRRVRSALSVSVGAGAEWFVFDYELPPQAQGTYPYGSLASRTYPRVLAAARYARTQGTAFGISPEDGFTVGATARERWRTDRSGSATLTTVGTATAYKSLNLPGFAHHVFAVRGAGGFADARATSYLEVGGVSGVPVRVIGDYTVGEGQEDFGVRGFATASLVGTRALAASAEYRLPLAKVGRGLGRLPFFVDRTSLSTFGDYGSAWCGAIAARADLACAPNAVQTFGLSRHRAIASIGAELVVTAAVFSWDAPYRFRLGVAHPVRDDSFAAAKALTVYFTSGLAF